MANAIFPGQGEVIGVFPDFCMNEMETDDLDQRKAELRRLGSEARGAMTDRGVASRTIAEKIPGLECWNDSRTVMCYVSLRLEVGTRELMGQAQKAGKQLVVPYCVDGELGLFHLESVDELSPGLMGILEPRAELRMLAGKVVDANELDLVLVPGVAFDRQGGRVGYGRGHYDKLLARVRDDAMKVGLAFECQVFEDDPVGELDVRMDVVVTESNVYG